MPMFARSSVLALSGAMVVVGALSLVAQEVAPTKGDVSKAKRTGDASRRVPDFFGEIGLTPEQRESIYKIREKHQSKIAELNAQIAAIRKAEVAECETVLSDTQKQLVAQRRRAAEERKDILKKKVAEKTEKKESAPTDAAK